MRDLLNNSTVKELAAGNTGNIQELASSLTVNGTSVDLIGEGRKCLLIIDVKKTSSATFSVAITSGTDNSTFGTTERAASIHDTTGLTVVDLEPSNRYIRAEWAASATGALSTHTYVDFAVFLIVYNERFRPSNVS